MAERWVDIKGYKGFYQVSDQGRIRSLTRVVTSMKSNCKYTSGVMRTIQGRIRSLNRAHGYPSISLHNGEKRAFNVHRIVAEHFVPNPDGLPQVNHKNGVKTDNRACNLEWCSPSQNTRHAFKSGLRVGPRGEKNGRAKLTEDNVRAIKVLLEQGLSYQKIANKYDVSKGTIAHIAKGRKWTHIN